MFLCIAEEHRTTDSPGGSALQPDTQARVPRFGPTEKRRRRRNQKASQCRMPAYGDAEERKNAEFAGASHVFFDSLENYAVISSSDGREGGIRTPDTVALMPNFECGAFTRSATSPRTYETRIWAVGAHSLPRGGAGTCFDRTR